MTIAILATGDEIVHGDTLNTNTHAIAHVLSSEGLSLKYQMSCSDKKADLVECLNFLCKQHDIVILIGGLGPTTDDLTRFALAEFTGIDLVQHPSALAHIKARLGPAKIAINEGNLQQCLFPEEAVLLPNPHGTAVGCFYQWKNKSFILLPGPPRECLPMFNQHVLPLLHKTAHSNKQILKWLIFGKAESEIAHILEDALKDIDCQTGYRLDTPYIEFKVRCKADLVDKVKSIIDPIIEPNSICSVNTKASTELKKLISSLRKPINIIDDATGGLLQYLISEPGTAQFVNFHSLSPTALSFHLTGLIEYWTAQPTTSQTAVSIQSIYNNKTTTESHLLPYRSPTVVSYAAEWLSFRLIELINQLHQ